MVSLGEARRALDGDTGLAPSVNVGDGPAELCQRSKMQKYRHWHEENRNEHEGVEANQLIGRLHREGLNQRRRGQETG